MKLGSLFDGIAGFPLAAVRHGIEPVWASEIEPFPISVSRRHFPQMRHLGDVSKINGAEIEPVDIITFGSPCQDLSVAGKRAGLEGERSSLFGEAVRIIREMRYATGKYPRFAVWENVPGAFSSNKCADFRAVLEEITASEIPMPASGKWATAGMVRTERVDVAWRVLDAQYWGVPQRRKRIFLVADFGGKRAGEILFEREGVSGDIETGREARQEAAAGAGCGTEAAGYRLTEFGQYRPDVCAGPVLARDYKGATDLVVTPDGRDTARTLTARGDSSPCVDREQNVVGVPNSIAFSGRQDPSSSRTPGAVDTFGWTQCVAYDPKDLGRRPATLVNQSPTLKARAGTGDGNVPITRCGYAVRRLTPTECERLMGFPDGWTAGGSDTARYKALGNSVAVPCVEFIMQRIAEAMQGD